MITDPRFAPKRTDLPWLRRRRLPRAARPAPVSDHPTGTPGAVVDFVTGHATGHHHEPTSSSAASASSSLDLGGDAHEAVADFVTGHSTGHAHPPAASSSPPAGSSSLDLDEPAAAPRRSEPSRPAASSSLDLDEPAARPSRPAASSSLDLDAPAPPSSRPAASSSLDLGEPATPPSRASARVPAETAKRRRADVRVRAGQRVILNVSEPTVTLTRLQSGIGALTMQAACSDAVGDLRIGCAYELASGVSSTVQLTQGNRLGPPGSRRPILVAAHDRFETISLDLRQCTDVRRLIVYAFSERRSPLNWGGTLITTTLGGARVELPLEALQSGDAAVLQSIYNVHGEFVLRAEMLTVFGDVREACRRYGFERITWLDDRTPVE